MPDATLATPTIVNLLRRGIHTSRAHATGKFLVIACLDCRGFSPRRHRNPHQQRHGRTDPGGSEYLIKIQTGGFLSLADSLIFGFQGSTPSPQGSARNWVITLIVRGALNGCKTRSACVHCPSGFGKAGLTHIRGATPPGNRRSMRENRTAQPRIRGKAPLVPGDVQRPNGRLPDGNDGVFVPGCRPCRPPADKAPDAAPVAPEAAAAGPQTNFHSE